MWKRLIIPLIICILFIASTILFWYLFKGFYDNPFVWTRFNNDFNMSLIPLGFVLVAMIFFSSLLTLVKPRSKHVYAVYAIAAATFVFFLPVSIVTIGVAVLFAVGFIFYEWSTNKLFHSYIKIDFWDTYTKTIPTLITFLTVVMALGQFQASIDHLDKLKVSIPTFVIQKAFESVSSDNVKGTSTIAQQQDPQEVDTLINKQLIEFGITDPQQQQVFREQVKQQMGLIESTPATESPSLVHTTTGTSSALLQKNSSFPGIHQIKENYQAQVVSQLKGQLEDQIGSVINRYRNYIPIINAVAIFFLLSILNLPVMLLSIALVVVTMSVLKRLKIIDVIKIKMDVERFAW